MNRKLLTVMALAVATAAAAQKPTEGNASSVEVQLNLTGTSNTIVAPGLKYRYFIAPNMAIRLGLDIANSKSTENFTENPDGTGAKGTDEVKTSGFSVAPGFEYHFEGTDRLSPYLGLTIGFGGGKAKETWTNYDGTGYASGFSATSDMPMSTFGVGLLAGTDFYFAQNFFVGAEMGFLMSSSTQKEGTVTISNNGQTSTTKIPEAKSSSMGFGETAAIRLGWRF